MTKKFIRRCPICQNESGEILHHQSFVSFEKYHLPESYDVVCCKRCGFVFADTSAIQQDYNRYYTEFSKYETGGTTKWDIEKIKPLSEFLPDKNVSILDIGCANGELLVELRKLGYKNLNGLDPAKKCVQNARGQGINVFDGELFSINSAIPEDKKFDCVIFSHVLEHIYDLNTAVDNIVSKLNENGLLYIEVPDASRYSEFFIVPYYFFDCEHINHFDENSLNNLFFKKGLNLLHFGKETIDHLESDKFYPVVYAIYQKISPSQTNRNITPDFKVKNSILRHIEESEKKSKIPEIEELSESGEKIVVWGAGSYAFRLLDNSPLSKCNILFFVDTDPKKHGMKIKNALIYAPDKLKEHNGPVVICSALYSDDILREIKNMGISNRVVVVK